MKKILLLFIILAALVVPGVRLQSGVGGRGRGPTARGDFSKADLPSIQPLSPLRRESLWCWCSRAQYVPHGLRFRELGVELKVSKEEPGRFEFTPNQVGDSVGHCIVFCAEGHGTMAHTPHVVG